MAPQGVPASTFRDAMLSSVLSSSLSSLRDTLSRNSTALPMTNACDVMREMGQRAVLLWDWHEIEGWLGNLPPSPPWAGHHRAPTASSIGSVTGGSADRPYLWGSASGLSACLFPSFLRAQAAHQQEGAPPGARWLRTLFG